MKTLRKLSLPSEEMRNLKGGIGDASITSHITTKPPITTPQPKPPACGCTCKGCQGYQEGNFFGAGMTIAGI